MAWNEDQFLLGSDFRHHVNGVAIYHQSSYDWRRWTFALNMRLDYEHTALSYHSYCNTGANGTVNLPQLPRPIQFSLPANIDETGRMKQSFKQFLPKLSVTYNLKNSAIFLSVAKGYKSGGFNTQMFSDFLKQEMIDVMKKEAGDLMGGMMGGGSGSGSGSGRPAGVAETDASGSQVEYTAPIMYPTSPR